MKKIFLIISFGFFIGITLTSLFSPSVISWYFDPPTSIGVSCKDAVAWGINAYQKMVMVGGGFGLLGGIILAILIGRNRPLQPLAPPMKP
ncbi:MAG TPA: hypothetical protein VNJ01_14090 [Bacteriovoracaceae bacterium]|nr:hypothetical protein [Bacteriovoracaceae bacterium]